jgi:hypothetical protein
MSFSTLGGDAGEAEVGRQGRSHEYGMSFSTLGGDTGKAEVGR